MGRSVDEFIREQVKLDNARAEAKIREELIERVRNAQAKIVVFAHSNTGREIAEAAVDAFADYYREKGGR